MWPPSMGRYEITGRREENGGREKGQYRRLRISCRLRSRFDIRERLTFSQSDHNSETDGTHDRVTEEESESCRGSRERGEGDQLERG